MLHALVFALLAAAPAPAPFPEPGEPAWVRPLPPAEGRADLLLILERPRPAEPPGGDVAGAVSVALFPAGGKTFPDLLLPTADRIYAAWYDLPAGPQRLVAGSRDLYLADRMIELRAGEVHRSELRLAPRRDLRVRIELPETLRRSPFGLEMRPLAPPARLPPWKVAAEQEEIVLEKLPPVDAEFVLRSPRWTFRAPLDLARDRGGKLFFDPDETNLHGYLTLGGRPATGKICFLLPDQKCIEVKTDGRGWYDAFLWRRGTYEIAVETGKNESYRFYYEVPEVARKVLDIDVPAARYQIRAIDRDSRRNLPLKKAKYVFRDEEDRLLTGDLRISGGKAILPPLGSGRLDLFLVADGYVEREWKNFQLSPEGPSNILVAELDRIEEWTSLRLVQADEEPVANAQLRIFRDGFAGELLWEGRSGSDGVVKVPGQYQGMPVLVRAQGLAFHADLLPAPTPSEEEWRLEKAPWEPTTLVVVDEESRPIAGAEVVVGIGRVWLRGEALAWLIGNTTRGPRTNGSGLLMMNDLPPRKLLLLARPASFDPAEIDGLAFHAKIIDPPAPQVVVVPATPD